jgi:RNA polymerase-binding transcription factor DksA
VSPDTQTSEIREIILERISAILRDTYKEAVHDLSEKTLSAKLAFKGDPLLNELRLALERIERGEYGRCIFCKLPIAAETLRKNPTAHFCERCAHELLFHTSRHSS